MLLLHSSNFSERYQRNILDFLCYPMGHIVTLRYQSQHVHPTVRALGDAMSAKAPGVRWRSRAALVIYAEDQGDQFGFFPVRLVDVVQLHREGTVYYIEARLGKFYSYASQPTGAFTPSQIPHGPLPFRSLVSWDQDGGLRPDAEVPEGVEGRKGYFVYEAAGEIVADTKGTPVDERQAWERVVDVVSSRDSMRQSLFYLVQLSEVRRRRILKVVPSPGFERVPLDPQDYGSTTRYHARSASRLELTVLSYRSPLSDRSALPVVLSLDLSPEAFGTASRRDLEILNRYNEERVEIPARRVLENTAGGIRLAAKRKDPQLPARSENSGGRAAHECHSDAASRVFDHDDANQGGLAPQRPAPQLAPEPYLLVYVRPPLWTLGVILLGAVTAALLLSLGPDSIPPAGRVVESFVSPPLGRWMQVHPGVGSAWAKAVGSVVTLMTGYLGLRRLPVGK